MPKAKSATLPIKQLLVALLLIVTIVAVTLFYRSRGAGGEYTVDEVQVGSEPIPPPSTVSESWDPDGSRISTPPASDHGFGGSDLNVQRAIKDSIAGSGIDSYETQTMIAIAQSTCGTTADMVGRSNPKGKWAREYIDHACSGFNLDEFTNPVKGYTYENSSKELGEGKAISKAKDELNNPSSLIQQNIAAFYLIENGEFPNQSKYYFEKETLAKAVTSAMALNACNRLHSCGPNSLMTAQICAVSGCVKGVNYTEALRGGLSSQEFDAALQIASSLRNTK